MHELAQLIILLVKNFMPASPLPEDLTTADVPPQASPRAYRALRFSSPLSPSRFRPLPTLLMTTLRPCYNLVCGVGAACGSCWRSFGIYEAERRAEERSRMNKRNERQLKCGKRSNRLMCREYEVVVVRAVRVQEGSICIA